MNKKQITEIIAEGYYRLDPISNVDWTDYLEIMYTEELKQERQHRAAAPFDIRPKFTASIVAKYWVIRAVRNAMRSDTFRPRDILHCKKSYLYAHAIKDDDRFDLDEMLNGFDWAAFDSIDYQTADLEVA